MNTTKHLRTFLIIGGAVALFSAGIWFGTAKKVEAPVTATNVIPSETIQPQNGTELVATTPDTVMPVPSEVSSKPTVTPVTPKPVATTPKATAPTKPSATSSRYPSYALITYKDESFTPRKVTIVKGGKVRFLNLSAKEDMWIASDLHPIHNGYPERDVKNCSGYAFDQCKSVGNGGYYEFTFERQGTFGFHNDMNPSVGGKVEVNLVDEKPSIPGY